jgi:SsrA-binding protein
MAKKKGKKTDLADPPQIVNRRARFDFHIDDTVECGMELLGTEVKQLRHGQAQMADAFARVEREQLWLHGVHIDPYPHAGEQANHEPRRLRRLLAHRREIDKLDAVSQERGITLVPLRIYFKDGRAKVEVGVARGKKMHDKRQDLKKKDADREIRRAMSQRTG